MKTTWINQAKKIFQEAQIPIQSGLSQRQLDVLEKLMGNIAFPPDYRQLLTQFLPTNRHHTPTDWRHLLSQSSIQPFLENTYSIIEQSCHATIVNFNGWQPDWGPCPNDKTQRWEKAKTIIKKSPPLLPVYGHRCINIYPHIHDHSVYSIFGTDVVFYGKTLFSYIQHEWADDHGDQFHADFFTHPTPKQPFINFSDAYNLFVFYNQANAFMTIIGNRAQITQPSSKQTHPKCYHIQIDYPYNFWWLSKLAFTMHLPPQIHHVDSARAFLQIKTVSIDTLSYTNTSTLQFKTHSTAFKTRENARTPFKQF